MNPKVSLSPVASAIPFLDDSLTSTNVQDAIVEVKTTSVFNVDKILADNHFDVLFDNEGNLLEGVL